MTDNCVRKILPNVKDFKTVWQEKGPFKYALTSAEYPPILMEPEEWIFGNDPVQVLKELMQFSQEKMAFVKAPFNPENKKILRPDDLSQWKINHFPEDWNIIVSDIFVPEGHLTQKVMDALENMGLDEDKAGVETAFFSLLEQETEAMGYILLSPRGKSKSAAIQAYLKEWEEDEADAGLI